MRASPLAATLAAIGAAWIVIDGDTIRWNQEPIRLEGIDTYEADETCKTKSGKTWPCGAKARAALTLFIRSRAVTCSAPQGGASNDLAARCSVMDQDISTWLVRRGWATPLEGEPELAEALDAAKTEKLGLWQVE